MISDWYGQDILFSSTHNYLFDNYDLFPLLVFFKFERKWVNGCVDLTTLRYPMEIPPSKIPQPAAMDYYDALERL
jgi:hypothetical protein